MLADEKILELIEHNPEMGAQVLMEKYLPLIRNVCSQKLHNREDIDECVNDVFAEFCLKYHEYNKEKSNLKNYLCTIAQRRAIDKYRTNCRKENIELKILEQYKEELESKGSQNSMAERLEEAMDKLETVDRKILEKYYYEGLTYREIAEELDMKYESVKKRGIRGKKKLLYFILLGLLILGITACTSVVMKKQGLLPCWFPFYNLIPIDEQAEEKKETEENGRNIVLKLETKEPEGNEVGNEMENIENPVEDSSITVKKYQISNFHGLTWSDEESYEMKPGTQKIQKGDMIYELKDIYYQNGRWDIKFAVSCTDTEQTSYIQYEEGTEDYIDGLLENATKKSWLGEAEEYLTGAYLLLAEDERCYLEANGYELVSREKVWVYDFTFCTEGILDAQKNEISIALVLPDGAAFEIVMDKIETKEYIPETEEQEMDIADKSELEEQKPEGIIDTGVAELKNGQAIVSLYQKNIGEYKIASMITKDYFGPIDITQGNPVLIDAEGNTHERSRINSRDGESGRDFEIYFSDIDEGDYILQIPYFCLQKEMTTESVEIPLPTGEETSLQCDIPVIFSDGTEFKIKSVVRHEYVGDIYHVDDGVLTREEQRYWFYEIGYETDEEKEYVFNVAKATGTTSIGGTVCANITSIEGEMKYVLKTESSEMPETMSVQFYNPLYVWKQEFTFHITFQN